MFEQINSLYASILALSRENQFLAAGLSMYGLAVLTYILRDIPRKVFAFIYSQSITTISVDNSGAALNITRFNSIVSFINGCSGRNFTRHFKLRSSIFYDASDIRENDDIEKEIQLGDGIHFFISHRKLFWVKRYKLDSNGTEREKAGITIYTLGRNRAALVRLIDAALPVLKEKDEVSLYRPCGSGWDRRCNIVPRSMDSIAAKQALKDDLIQSVQEFLDSEAWYIEKGITYKEVHVLHGPTGTGKTSLIRAIATYFKLPIFEVDLSSVSNSSLLSLLDGLPKRCICLVEDFESSGATKKRARIEVVPSEAELKPGDKSDKSDNPSSLADLNLDMLTISGLLNALDGISGPSGVIYFLSTNCIASIDPAILRKGRTDWLRYIGAIGDEEIKNYIRFICPTYSIPEDITFGEMVGCNLYAAFKENKHDVHAFVNSLPLANTHAHGKKIVSIGGHQK